MAGDCPVARTESLMLTTIPAQASHIFLPISLSVSLSVSVCLCLSLSVSVCLCLSLSLSFVFLIFFSPLSGYPPLQLFYFLILSPSHCNLFSQDE
jgi:hypothetical protein